jgi:hypothetical protein
MHTSIALGFRAYAIAYVALLNALTSQAFLVTRVIEWATPFGGAHAKHVCARSVSFTQHENYPGCIDGTQRTSHVLRAPGKGPSSVFKRKLP